MKNQITLQTEFHMKLVHQSIYIIICIVFLSTSLFASTHFVATNGNDDSPGTESQPWRTIQKAANTLVAGDILYIKSGSYNERVMPMNSGNAGNYIVYAAYSGNVVTIDGNGVTLPAQEPGGLFDLSQVNYIKISGLRIINAGPNSNNPGILIEYCKNIIISNNYTYNTLSSGIGVWDSENITVDGNEVELACNYGEQECITIAATNNFEIKNNYVHNGGPEINGAEGICLKDGSSNGKVYDNHVSDLPGTPGIYVDAWDKHTKDIEIFRNVVNNCGSDGIILASEQGGLLENVTVYNNISYNNKYSGIVITPNGDVPDSPMKNISIINNTVYNSGWNSGAEPWGGGIDIENPNLSNFIIRNNILSQNLLFQIEVVSYGTNSSIDHNLIDGFRNELAEEIRGDNYVEGNPLFVNPSSADFHLQTNSPAIDKGSALQAPNTDFDGNVRPAGSSVDIGAFEFASTSEVSNMLGNSMKSFSLEQNYPNPFNPATKINYSVPILRQSSDTHQGKISERMHVSLKVYDILGREVATLVNKQQTIGYYEVEFNASSLPSGIYLYRLQITGADNSKQFVQTKKMVLLK